MSARQSLRSLSACLVLSAQALSTTSCDRVRSQEAGIPATRFTRANAKAVFLAGQFNDWSATATPMRRNNDGTWMIDLPLPPGKYEYKFVADGQWEQDLNNPDTAPDGWGGLNSVVTVPPPPTVASVAKGEEKEIVPAPLLRKEVRWKRIWYPDFKIPGTENRTMTALISGATPEFDGQRDGLGLTLLFEEPAGAEMPAALAHPEEFVVQLHLPDGSIIASAIDPHLPWDGAGNSSGMTRSRTYAFPWTRNAFDEAWIEWRLPAQTFWFEIPYGFTRDPTKPWPAPEPERSEPKLAPAMQNLPQGDRMVPWRFVEYDVGKIPNHVWLSARLANPFRPAADVVLHDNDFVWSWTAENPKTAIQLKGQDEGWRVAFRKQGRLDRFDTFRLSYGGSDKGRDTAAIVIHVDDRSYEFTVPSSLFKYVHGTADYENKQRLPRGDNLFEQLVRLSD